MVKVLAACGNGMGSSMVIKMKVENALRKLNQRDFTVNSCSVGEAKGLAVGYDIVIASLHLIQELEGRTNGKLIGLDNLIPNHSYLSQLDVTYKTPDLMSHFLPPHEVSFTFCCSSIVFPR